MSASDKNKQKIHRTLKSLFRYSKFKETSAPDILITGETRILKQSLSNLTPDDFYHIVVAWSAFYIEQVKELEVDNATVSQEMENIENINKHIN